jgi:hypothetical protein
MADFKNWMITEEACFGYVLADLAAGLCDLLEATTTRKSKPKATPSTGNLPPLEKREPMGKVIMPKFNPKTADKMAPYNDKTLSCPITPLSGYADHIRHIQKFALSSPENFAQTMMFSPLSANVPFPKHWDNFYVLMLLLKHYYPQKVSPEELRELIKVFDDKYHSLGHTINGIKLNTIAEIWNEKENLFRELPALAHKSDDKILIQRLCRFTGVQPVKAGFMVQLLFGRAGCIDTHNIDIYSTIFPDMAKELGHVDAEDESNDKKSKNWKISAIQAGKDKIAPGVDSYVNTLQKLAKRGFGTQQIWDVWVDFVENFYRYISAHGMGAYMPMGSAIDPNDPAYKGYEGILIRKTLPAGRHNLEGQGRKVWVPAITDKGRGASATHLMMDPDEMFKQRVGMYRHGKPGGYSAASVPFPTIKNPFGEKEPLDRSIGMGSEPSDVHYFARPGEKEIDPEYVRHIIRQRLASGGRKGRNAANQE